MRATSKRAAIALLIAGIILLGALEAPVAADTNYTITVYTVQSTSPNPHETGPYFIQPQTCTYYPQPYSCPHWTDGQSFQLTGPNWGYLINVYSGGGWGVDNSLNGNGWTNGWKFTGSLQRVTAQGGNAEFMVNGNGAIWVAVTSTAYHVTFQMIQSSDKTTHITSGPYITIGSDPTRYGDMAVASLTGGSYWIQAFGGGGWQPDPATPGESNGFCCDSPPVAVTASTGNSMAQISVSGDGILKAYFDNGCSSGFTCDPCWGMTVKADPQTVDEAYAFVYNYSGDPSCPARGATPTQSSPPYYYNDGINLKGFQSQLPSYSINPTFSNGHWSLCGSLVYPGCLDADNNLFIVISGVKRVQTGGEYDDILIGSDDGGMLYDGIHADGPSSLVIGTDWSQHNYQEKLENSALVHYTSGGLHVFTTYFFYSKHASNYPESPRFSLWSIPVYSNPPIGHRLYMEMADSDTGIPLAAESSAFGGLVGVNYGVAAGQASGFCTYFPPTAPYQCQLHPWALYGAGDMPSAEPPGPFAVPWVLDSYPAQPPEQSFTADFCVSPAGATLACAPLTTSNVTFVRWALEMSPYYPCGSWSSSDSHSRCILPGSAGESMYIVGYFHVTLPTVPITVTSQPPKGSGYVAVDGTPVTTTLNGPRYSWVPGSIHTLAANAKVACGAGCYWYFAGWSSTSIGTVTSTAYLYTVPASGETVTANYASAPVTITSSPVQTQHQLGFVTVGSAPITTPQPESWNPGETHHLYANSPVSCGTNCQWTFTSWTTSRGSGSSSQDYYYPVPSTADVVTANYRKQVKIVINSTPLSAVTVKVDGSPQTTTYTTPWWDAGLNHTLIASPTVSCGTGCEYVFTHWSSQSIGSINSTSFQYTVPSTPETLTANYARRTQPTVEVIVTSSPDTDAALGTAGLFVSVNGSAIDTPATYADWVSGNTQILSINSPGHTIQCPGIVGCRYLFQSWQSSVRGVLSSYPQFLYTVQVYNETVTAVFVKQYLLTMQVNPVGAGTTTPQAGSLNWYSSGTSVQITASPGGNFTYWTGLGTGNYTGTGNPANVTMNGPVTEIANFVPPVWVTVRSTPQAGAGFVSVAGVNITTPDTVPFGVGTQVALHANKVVNGANGVQYVFSYWNVSSVTPHNVTSLTDYQYQVPSANDTVTAVYTARYQLNMRVNPAGAGSTAPPSTSGVCGTGCYWYSAGSFVPISLTPNSGYKFTGWTGSGSGSYTGPLTSPPELVINAPINETANFAPTVPGTSVNVTVTSDPPGAGFVVVDNEAYSTPQTFTWLIGSYHNLTATPHSCGSSCEYDFMNWTAYSFGTQTNAFMNYTAPSTDETVTADFSQLTGPRVTVQITITSNPTGVGFAQVDGTPIATPQTYTWRRGSTHTLLASSLVGCGTGSCRYTFTSWSSPSIGAAYLGNPVTYTVPSSPETVTANFQKQYPLTMKVTPTGSGTTTPSSATTSDGCNIDAQVCHWENANSTVAISANPANGYMFKSWAGTGTGSYSGIYPFANVTMKGPITETANFVLASFDFTVFASPAEQTVVQGQQAWFTVTVLKLYGTPQAVNLTIAEAGTAYAFNPATGTPNPSYSSNLTVTTYSSTTIGDHTLTVVGTSNSIARVTTIILHVVSTPAGDFVIHLNPAASRAESTGTLYVTTTVVPLYGYAELVSLSTSPTPTGITVDFSPQSGYPRFSSTMTVTTSGVDPGLYVLQVVGTGGTGAGLKVHTVPFLLYVEPNTEADFVLSTVPPEIAVPIPALGVNTKALFLTATPFNSFSGTVTLNVPNLPARVQVSLQPTEVTIPPIATSKIGVQVQPSAVPGEYGITITGTCDPGACTDQITRRTSFLLTLYEPASIVLVTILTPADNSTVRGTQVSITANITDALLGPQNIVSANFEITGPNYNSGNKSMSHNGVWTWTSSWDSTEATLQQGGPYTLAVVGTNKDGITGSDTVTFNVSNTGLRPLQTYYINYITDPNGAYSSMGWKPEQLFLPGETIGVRALVTDANTGIAPSGVMVFNSTGDVTSQVLAPNVNTAASFGSDGYLYATMTIAGIGPNAPNETAIPAAVQYNITIPYTDTLGNRAAVSFPFRIVRLGVGNGWSVINGFDHADVVATLSLSDEKPLLGREGTIRASATIGQNNVPVTGYVDSNGVMDIYVPYYDWTSSGVTFALTYVTSNYPVIGMFNAAVTSSRIPYNGLGITYYTSGTDATGQFVENVQISTFRKNDTTPVLTWVAVQVPEVKLWASQATDRNGNVTFPLHITPPQQTFNVQAWVYALNSSEIFTNQYSNLNIVTENIETVVSGVKVTRTATGLQMSGTLTLDTATMNLNGGVQVVVTVTDTSGNPIATMTSNSTTLQAGVPKQVVLTYDGAVSPGTYRVQVTATYLPTGWNIGAWTSTVSL